MPTISVIIPVYNVEQFLCRCIDSVLIQSFSDFEMILVDDGSPDNCGKICDDYAKKDDRIIVIHKKNGGLSDARNIGLEWALKNSNSDWLSFIDSDDWIHPRYLETLYYGAVDNNVLLSMCRYKETSAESDCCNIVKSEIANPESGYFPMMKKLTAHAWGKLYKKELFKVVRYPVGKLYEDMFVTHRILFMLERIAITESPLYNYYINPDSIARGKWTIRQLDQIEAYEKELIPFFKTYSIETYTFVKSQYIKTLMDQYKWAKDDNETRQAIHIKMKCLKAIIRFSGLRIFPIVENSWRYENVFPRFMRFYWLFRSNFKLGKD